MLNMRSSMSEQIRNHHIANNAHKILDIDLYSWGKNRDDCSFLILCSRYCVLVAANIDNFDPNDKIVGYSGRQASGCHSACILKWTLG